MRPHGGVKAAGSPARGGGNLAVGHVDQSADCCADSIPWGYLPWGGEGGDFNDAPPAAHGSRAAAVGEDGAYLCGSLEGWGELKQWPRAQPSGSRFGWSASTGRTAAVVFAAAARRESIAAARCVRRSNARGVRAA